MTINKMLQDLGVHFEIREPAQISVQICNQLRNAISRGVLKGGQRIVETDLTSALGVSRPPVREALQKLALEGFVEIVPYKGARVTRLTPEGAREHFEIKAMVEGFAGYVAAERFGQEAIRKLQGIHDEMRIQIKNNNVEGVLEANFNYHQSIVNGVGNSKLSSYYRQLTYNIRRYGTIGLTKEKRIWDQVLKEHGQILDAIRNRDPLRAEEASRFHTLVASHRVEASLKKSVEFSGG